MRRIALLLVVVAGCTKAGTAKEAPAETPPAVAPIPAKPSPPPKTTTRVELTAVTLADDCGGTAPWGPPATVTKSEGADPEEKTATKAKGDMAAGARMKRRCEQTSMQLAIIATDAAAIQIKSVELIDESGASIGMLTATKPTMWSATASAYQPWDEKVAAGTANVSYVLSQPAWGNVKDRWNKTFTLKTVVSVGGVDQTATKDVTLSAPTSLPPNVRT
jgi:hypothetical protein